MVMAVPGVLGEFAPILRGMARLGIPAPSVWQMELHDIAASLGVHEAAVDPALLDAQAVNGGPGLSGADLAAERTRRAQEGQPGLEQHLATVPADTSIAPVSPQVIEALRQRRAQRGR